MAKRKRKQRGRPLKLYALIAAIAIALALHLIPGAWDLVSRYLPFLQEPRQTTPTNGEMSVHFLDVGQGDCSLIIMPSGETMLIDASTVDQSDKILEYIASCGVTKLNYFVLTHPHSDHIGGAKKVMQGITTEKVIMTDAEHTSSTFEKLTEYLLNSNIDVIFPKPNDTFSLGQAKITVLGPVKEYKDLNDTSLVIRLDYGKTSFMFTGDAEHESENDMLSYHSKSEFKADVLKLGHHGSYTSSGESWLDAVAPAYAIASCGVDNEYGHPHTETVQELNKRGITFFRTDEQGNIVFSSDGEKVTVVRPGK